MVTAAAIKAHATELGFDLCGIAPATSLPELAYLEEWIDQGYAGTMDYLSRTAKRRGDVRNVIPSAKTVIALATIYNVDRPYSTEVADESIGKIARYAWGEDYHAIIGHRTENLLKWMREEHSSAFEAKAYVDTGPVQERVYAQHAGLGWIGKNTCVINADLGSWLYLSEIISDLPLGTDVPALDQCGTCTLCLDACPTDALTEPWVLDSNRCLAYLTIESKDSIPESYRQDVGTNVFGCDICQDVCPWNANPPVQSSGTEFLPRGSFDQPQLVGLWQRSDVEWRKTLKGSALKRASVVRWRRNVAVALGNSATPEGLAALEENPPESPSCDDPLVIEHVEWAKSRAGRKT
jgi:epoxyqueuosine reductase